MQLSAPGINTFNFYYIYWLGEYAETMTLLLIELKTIFRSNMLLETLCSFFIGYQEYSLYPGFSLLFCYLWQQLHQ